MASPAVVVLLIEDEPQMRRFLRAALENGSTSSSRPALRVKVWPMPPAATGHHPSGPWPPRWRRDRCHRRIRESSSRPIIVLSARGREADKVAALDAGADDYLTKPFGVDELLARMRVALRHAARAESGKYGSEFVEDSLRVDLGRRQVFFRGEEVHLTPHEYRLLQTLIQHAGKVVTHRQLLKDVWGINSIGQTTTCGFTWPSSGISSRRIRLIRGCC